MSVFKLPSPDVDIFGCEMRQSTNSSPLIRLLSDLYIRPHCRRILPAARRTFSTTIRKHQQDNHEPSHIKGAEIGVLGGGITGLATAYFLTHLLPGTKITLYEASSRLGGWLQSKSVGLEDGKEILFEQGPRNLRPSYPNGMVTLYLIQLLGLETEMLTTSTNSPAAQNRFIYYPDHLVRMPHPSQGILRAGMTFFSEPIFKGAFPALLREPFVNRRPEDLDDESVGDMISRRFSKNLADNVLSAVLHGIYAGDVYNLSAKSLMPAFWNLEGRRDGPRRQRGSLVMSMLQGPNLAAMVQEKDVHLMTEVSGKMEAITGRQADEQEGMSEIDRESMIIGMKESSVFTFRKGLGQLADSLVAALEKNSDVEMKQQCPINRLEKVPSDQGASRLQLSYGNSESQTHSHIVSTISAQKLASISTSTNLKQIVRQKSVTVMVVNLYYSNPSLLPVSGFGYLLPRSLPFEQNPERALGVVFDSDATIGQDSIIGTKVTVMLGGHWWDDWSSYPDEQEAVRMACAVLKRHLKITEQPAETVATLQRDCIPQYHVGFTRDMTRMHGTLLDEFEGKLSVAGSSYTGVGVNDCIRSGYDVAQGLANSLSLIPQVRNKHGKDGVLTGLETVVEEPKVRLRPGRTLKDVFNNGRQAIDNERPWFI
ncbi:oxygen-dependent protoporphyrinogen oxidase [Agyrium rufum]|nr:oxygen-dependent protoporphyrinogen oxidase [Agyrium rufum]